MKRIIYLLFALALLLSGCGGKEDSATEQTAYNIVQVMLASLDESEEADSLTWYQEPEAVGSYLTNVYRTGDISLNDAAVVRMEGARAFELAVLFVDEGDADAASEAMQEYLTSRRAAFTGYFPDQANLVDKGMILTRGQCVALVVCNDPEAAKTCFESCFGDGVNAKSIPAVPSPAVPSPASEESGTEESCTYVRLEYVDPGIDDMTLFDSSAILSAWESGDASKLSEEDKQVLDAAAAVFEDYITPDMSDYEKERAIYIWLTTHAVYDGSHYEPQGAPRSSYEPYGPLINGTGVCLGYAEAFRLMMDMAGVECITVTGAAYQNRENHAWNMVKLNGNWYCVDPTWDHHDIDEETLSDFPIEMLMQFYNYFNVTSQYLADTDHQWDYDNTPEATAEDGGQP